MGSKRLALLKKVPMSWEAINGKMVIGIAVAGDPQAPLTKISNCWPPRSSVGQKAAVFEVCPWKKHLRYRVGLLFLQTEEARLATRSIRSKRFAVGIGPNDCEVFIVPQTGRCPLRLRLAARLPIGCIDKRTPLL